MTTHVSATEACRPPKRAHHAACAAADDVELHHVRRGALRAERGATAASVSLQKPPGAPLRRCGAPLRRRAARPPACAAAGRPARWQTPATGCSSPGSACSPPGSPGTTPARKSTPQLSKRATHHVRSSSKHAPVVVAARARLLLRSRGRPGRACRLRRAAAGPAPPGQAPGEAWAAAAAWRRQHARGRRALLWQRAAGGAHLQTDSLS